MRSTMVLRHAIMAIGYLSYAFGICAVAEKAEWSLLVYMAADNSLASFASRNIEDMSAGLASTKGIYVLVQWDKPNDNHTWRYLIVPGSKIDAGTLPTEMGYDPEMELASAMQWVVENYPATNYALVLWNHGSGIEDFYPGTAQSRAPWLNIIPCPQRGILYDDTQKTCLTNDGLRNALVKINQLIGKKLDLIAMDACLMAMVEVAYQMKDLVTFFVGSQQTIPGNGYPYSHFIKPLSLNPAGTTPLALSINMVDAYKTFYSTQQPTTDFTLSVIDVPAIELLKNNIDQFVAAFLACNAIDATHTKNIITTARKASISFEMAEYIDLYSFYANVLHQIKKATPKSSLILPTHHNQTKPLLSPEFKKALTAIAPIIEEGLKTITKVVLHKAAGPVYAGAQGISIYFPANGIIDDTYGVTLFAQNTDWINFIQLFS
ncbi:MAG: clostripain-related cysteine peptidase [Candidatus Babeliales bacterium]